MSAIAAVCIGRLDVGIRPTTCPTRGFVLLLSGPCSTSDSVVHPHVQSLVYEIFGGPASHSIDIPTGFPILAIPAALRGTWWARRARP